MDKQGRLTRILEWEAGSVYWRKKGGRTDPDVLYCEHVDYRTGKVVLSSRTKGIRASMLRPQWKNCFTRAVPDPPEGVTILPCPFCGSRGKLMANSSVFGNYDGVTCVNPNCMCMLLMADIHLPHTVDQVVAPWNKRPRWTAIAQAVLLSRDRSKSLIGAEEA